MTTRAVPSVVLAAVMVAAFAHAGVAAPSYTITDLGNIGDTYTAARGINDAGEVVGRGAAASGYAHAFIWQDGVISDLGTAIGPFGGSNAEAINNAGQIAGWSYGPDHHIHAAVWQGGAWTFLPELGTEGGMAYDINSSGAVAGMSYDPSGSAHGFMWDGVLHDIAGLGGYSTYAAGINDSGMVVGYSETASWETHAFMWQDGVMTDLGHLGSGISAAESVNNLGDAVGYSCDASWKAYATLWQDGALINLGIPDGATDSMAFDINDSGQIICQVYYASEGWQAVLYEDGVWTNLNDFLPAGSPWMLQYPMAINSSGQIAGYGSYNGETRAFLLTPDTAVPAPGALMLGLLGLGGIGAARRTRRARR